VRDGVPLPPEGMSGHASPEHLQHPPLEVLSGKEGELVAVRVTFSPKIGLEVMEYPEDLARHGIQG
jgi:hypothetical protein